MGSNQKKAVFLDRDGVINHAIVREGKPYPPRNEGEFKIMDGVLEGLQLLKEAGFLLIVVTNQPDVGRGDLPQAQVEAIHQKMMSLLPLDDVKVCYDDGKLVNSEFRKPNPGMLLVSAQENNIDLKKSYMIGDRWRDVDAGKRAGVMTIFIDYGYSEELKMQPDYRAASLLEAAKFITSKQ